MTPTGQNVENEREKMQHDAIHHRWFPSSGPKHKPGSLPQMVYLVNPRGTISQKLAWMQFPRPTRFSDITGTPNFNLCL
jgi:hypothetical protein